MAARRVMRKVLSGCVGSIHDDVPEIDTGTGWKVTLSQHGTYAVYYQQTYFDLSGYTKEQETTFPAAVVFQEMGSHWNQAGALIFSVDYVTKKPIRVSDLTSEQVVGDLDYIGQGTSRFSLEEIFYANLKVWRDSADIAGSSVLTESINWGVADATAAEKLYITRVFYLIMGLAPAITQYVAPPCGVIVPVLVAAEPDLEYIMRLKRSYELEG